MENKLDFNLAFHFNKMYVCVYTLYIHSYIYINNTYFFKIYNIYL